MRQNRSAGGSGGTNPGGEIIGAITGSIAVVVGVLAYGNWLAFEAASGEAGAALAGAFLTFEIILVILALFMGYTVFMRWLEGRQQNEAFVANAMENAQIRQQDTSAALQMAKLAQEEQKARKIRSDADYSQHRLEKSQTAVLEDEVKRLQGLVAKYQEGGQSDGWGAVDYTGFDDGAVVIDQHQ